MDYGACIWLGELGNPCVCVCVRRIPWAQCLAGENLPSSHSQLFSLSAGPRPRGHLCWGLWIDCTVLFHRTSQRVAFSKSPSWLTQPIFTVGHPINSVTQLFPSHNNEENKIFFINIKKIRKQQDFIEILGHPCLYFFKVLPGMT